MAAPTPAWFAQDRTLDKLRHREYLATYVPVGRRYRVLGWDRSTPEARRAYKRKWMRLWRAERRTP